MTRANEARVQLLLEENVDDVFNEIERVQRAFTTIEFAIGGRLGGQETGTTAEELKQAFADVKDGGEKIEQLVKAHLRNVERSVI